MYSRSLVSFLALAVFSSVARAEKPGSAIATSTDNDLFAPSQTI